MLITQELILKHTNYAKMSKLCEEFEIAGNFISCEHNRFTPHVKSSPPRQFFSTYRSCHVAFFLLLFLQKTSLIANEFDFCKKKLSQAQW
jgi:hypothetical protein